MSNCVECEGGVLVLDEFSIPRWKLVCNRCDVIVRLFDDAIKVSVLANQACEECDAQLLRVQYKEDKTKLADGKSSKEGCVYCDPEVVFHLRQ